jgi:glycogen phosphorylase
MALTLETRLDTEQLQKEYAKMAMPHVAYFCMEMAFDQSLHTYSGGLGFLAGSHMLSAGALGLPMVGVTILWAHGYSEQVIKPEREIELQYVKRDYPFLKDTGVSVDVTIFGRPVKVKALLLEPKTFGSAPTYFLTTDVPENSPEDRRLTEKLYDSDERIRIAQEIILGVAGVRILKALNVPFDLVHMNEGHALPAAFELLRLHGQNMDEVRRRLVFTTHTPVAAGNESHNVDVLHEAGFFVETHKDEAVRLGGHDFSLTVAALRMSRLANGVSQLHGHVANNMWSWVEGRCPIVAITNATNLKYWQDPRVASARNAEQLLNAKAEMRKELVEYANKISGKNLDPNVFTVVWARRFTEYKRADLIFRDLPRIKRLLEGKKLQLIFAGKFHPKDTWGKNTWNKVLKLSDELPGVAVLPGYELEMSGQLKRGSDIWLNTPLRPLEASGTSGMSANFNGSLHLSTLDGWAVEGTYHNHNGWIINKDNNMDYLPAEERHQQDYESMMHILENEIIPLWEGDKAQWATLMRRAVDVSVAYFHSDRMAVEYYTRLYSPAAL